VTKMLLDRHIEITPDVRSGKPRIAGTRITVADVAIKHLELGQSLEEIARKFHLSLAAVHAGMAYYYDHRAEIDASIEADEAFVEASKRDNPSILQEKLKHHRGE
jgi:uncharacterized protein (DUF433 family)